MKYPDTEIGLSEVKTKEDKKKGKNLVLKTVFHFLALFHNLGLTVYGLLLIRPIMTSEDEFIRFMGHHAVGFITLWNFIGFQTTFLCLAMLHDLLEWKGRHHSTLGEKVAYWRDVVFSGVMMPYTWFITILFWTIWSVDRELVFPKVFDAFIPFWANHGVHTNIFIFYCLETLLQARRNSRDKKMDLILFGTAFISYTTVYFSIYFVSGRFLYGVHDIMTWWQIAVFQIFTLFVGIFFYYIQFPINRIFHGPDETPAEQNGLEDLRGAVVDPMFLKSYGSDCRNASHNDVAL